MRIIGVIDLKAGKAVHARGGSRESYEPVQSALLATDHVGDAIALTRAYRDLLGLSEIYVADLDRIVYGGHPSDTLTSIAQVGVPLMVDAGVTSVESAAMVMAMGTTRVVVGLETLTSFDELDRVVAAAGAPHVVFSIDVRGEHVVAHAEPALARLRAVDLARRAAECGVTALILLDLARVGQQSGPDVASIENIRAVLPDVELISGGGLRGRGDLELLAAAGCDAALVGTALHTGHW